MSDRVVDFTPVRDSLLRNPQLDHAVDLPVLGMVTRFESNSAHVIRTVEQAFDGWRCLGEVGNAADESLCVRIVVHEGVEQSSGPVPVQHIDPGDGRLIVHSRGSVAISDPSRRSSVAYVTTAMAADRDHFRSAVLEPMTLALLAHFDRHPIHAAGVGRSGRAVLLAGASGTGKSTLAHLAHTAGMDVLSEDHVWVQLRPTCRVWGSPGHARLFVGGSAQKLIVELPGSDRASCYVAESAVVCVLQHGPIAALERIDMETIIDALARDLAPGFDRFPERHAVVTRALAANGGWRLTLSTDPHDALPFLEQMVIER